MLVSGQRPAAFSPPHRRHEGAQLDFIQPALGAHLAAQVQSMGLHGGQGLPDVVGMQAAGQEQRLRVHGVADAPAGGPVMRAAGTAQLLDGQRRVAAVQQQLTNNLGFAGVGFSCESVVSHSTVDALVAAMTSALPDMKASWLLMRSSSGMPAW